ncbi:MAG: hypothetical protein H0W40_11530 [Methylibium sp.]|uniref:hypothetical protein n=1 Tax=Methylibium sp. TaxID=2067992 RepID=UPI0017A209E2|nr:hypothetical protein [Methylibium sp.]MBA3597988.1 hypothetical protein [Methylibium sp.]
MTQDDKALLLAHMQLHRYAEHMLGKRGWFLLSSFGRVMRGQYSGQYVSGVPTPVARSFVDTLAAGGTVAIHLMHRYKSGNYESSHLRIVAGSLVMVFQDREESA